MVKCLRLRTVSPPTRPDPTPRLPAAIAAALGMKSGRPILTFPDIPTDEIGAAFNGYEAEYPPILNLRQAAKLAHLGESTLKRWSHEGRFPKSVKSNKPLLFWRNRFVHELFKGVK